MSIFSRDSHDMYVTPFAYSYEHRIQSNVDIPWRRLINCRLTFFWLNQRNIQEIIQRTIQRNIQRIIHEIKIQSQYNRVEYSKQSLIQDGA